MDISKTCRKKENLGKEEKIQICRKIFRWKKRYLKSREGARIFRKSGQYLWVFGGSWAHAKPKYGEQGHWSRIHLLPEGIEYWAGYKWMPGPSQTFTKPEEMAKWLSCKYLKEFWEEIKTRRIYEYIREIEKEDEEED